MITVTLNGLATRRLRAALTAIAIVVGVAMISGTYVMMDTTLHAFNTVFATAYSKADAIVVGKNPIAGAHNHANVPPVSAAVAERIRALPQVKDAQGFIDDKAEIRNAQGAALTGPGSPLAFGVPGHGSPLDTLTVITGHLPLGPGEIALDEQTATTNHFKLGATVGIVSRHPLRFFRVVGLVRFGGVQSLGPMQLLVFDLPVAQQLFDKQGFYDEVNLSARAGVSGQQLVRAIAPLLPATAEVKTQAAQVKASTDDVDEGMAIVRYVLLAFGGIALFVGSFVIVNTLSITVAQRTRELATLRMLGASRGQLLATVVLEALVIGVVASLIGLIAGLGLAKALESMFASMGMQLPNAGTVFAPRTVIVSLAAGITVTLAASLMPAVRATRVAPIDAVREAATLTPGRRWLIAPLASLVGRPLAAVSGVAGMLARENSARDPARTALSAGAISVALALVAFVATLGAGLRTTFHDSVRRQLAADYVISADRTALSPSVGAALAAHSAIQATGIRSGQLRAFGATETVSGVDPSAIAGFYRFAWARGSDAGAIAALTNAGAIVSQRFAGDHHLTLGSRFSAQTQSGTRLRLTVCGVQRTPTFGAVLGAVTISTRLFDRSFLQPGDSLLLVHAGGARPGARALVAKLLSGFPDAKINTVGEYATSSATSINTLLNLFYVLLALSVVVSLFGIVNTLALSIVERTREIGTLRAIGMTRRQLTRMIRVESEITAMIGATIGIVVGLALAALASAALRSWSLTFSVPWTTLLLLAAGAFVAGSAAGVFPARRAARLDPLDALSYE